MLQLRLTVSATTHKDGDLNVGNITTQQTIGSEVAALTFTYSLGDDTEVVYADIEAIQAQPKSHEGILYYTATHSSTPDAPTNTGLSYNFATRVITGLPASVTQQPITLPEGTTTANSYRVRYVVSEEFCGAPTQTFTFGTPEVVVIFGTDIQSDSFVEGSAGWRLERDTGNLEANDGTFRGTLGAGVVEAENLATDFLLTRTVRSPNYVAPTLTENPPNQGYSLEHGQGIGFFEEVRANVTGTLQAPSATPSSGLLSYGAGSVSTKEYMNLSVGTAFQNYETMDWVSGNVHTFRGFITDPIWRLEDIENLKVDTVSFPTNAPGRFSILNFNQSAVEIYSNLSTNSLNGQTVRLILVGAPYSGNTLLSNFVPLSYISATNGSISNASPGHLRSIISSQGVDSANVNGIVPNTGVRIPVGSTIPDRVDLSLGLFYSRSYESSVSPPPIDGDSPVAFTAGINANSSVTLTIETDDGSSTTRALTQL